RIPRRRGLRRAGGGRPANRGRRPRPVPRPDVPGGARAGCARPVAAPGGRGEGLGTPGRTRRGGNGLPVQAEGPPSPIHGGFRGVLGTIRGPPPNRGGGAGPGWGGGRGGG